MARCVPGMPPADRGTAVPRGAGRPVIPVRGRLRGHIPLQVVVVRGVARGLRRRPASHRQEPARLHERTEPKSVVAGPPRKSLRKVSPRCARSVHIDLRSTHVIDTVNSTRPFLNFRLHGSYEALKYGTLLDGIADLTGGISESITLKTNEINNYDTVIENLLKMTSVVTCKSQPPAEVSTLERYFCIMMLIQFW